MQEKAKFIASNNNYSIKTIPLYYKQNRMSRKYYVFWKKENQNPVISDFANILKEMF